MNRKTAGWISGRWIDLECPPPKTHVLEAWFPESIWKASKAFKGGNCVTVCFQWNYGTLGSFLLPGDNFCSATCPLPFFGPESKRSISLELESIKA